MNNVLAKRNITLDYFKLILALIVVTAHIQPLFLTRDSIFGWLISCGLTRVTVPCFLMINGYYLFSKIENNKAIYKYLWRMIIVYITWAAFYMPYTFGGSVFKTMINLVFGYHHLWYMPALIVAVAMFFILKKIIKDNRIFIVLSFVLYFTGVAIQYSFTSTSMLELVQYRNGVFAAFPYLFFGYYFRSIQDKLMKININYIYAVVVIGFLGMLFESYISWQILSERDMFVVSIFFCPALVLAVFRNSKYAESDGYVGLLSAAIYFIHLFAIMLVRRIFGFGGVNYIYALPMVYILSAMMSVAIIELNKRFKIFL